MLTIELVPKTCFRSNLRSILPKEDWDKLRRETYKKAGNRCEICGGSGSQHPVECHEIWHYDDDAHVQKLVGLIALCPKCHGVKHYGYSQLNGKEAEMFAHLMTVNKWGRRKASDHVEEAFQTWGTRSGHCWKQDLSWLRGKVATSLGKDSYK